MIFVLSLTPGIPSQTFRMDAKIRAFLAAAMRRGEVTGRSSATGSPRLSITITPPSAASRTNFDVLMCSSRTHVVPICYQSRNWKRIPSLEHMIEARSPEFKSQIPRDTSFFCAMVGPEGFEPSTNGL